jgi:hypothetical protein
MLHVFARFTHPLRLALLVALFALVLTAQAVTAAPGYAEPLRTTGARHDARSSPASLASDMTARETTLNTDNARDAVASTTDVRPNPLPDPRVSASTSTTGAAPNPLPDPRPTGSGVALPAAGAPAPMPPPRT